MTADPRYDAAVAAIDAVNDADPDGRASHEAARVLAWRERLATPTDDAGRLAALAHHLGRWRRPRRDAPAGRAGYLRWRADQLRRQAEEVDALLAEAGYDEALRRQVAQIVAKRDRAGDPAVQAHEDAVCLVFLEEQLDDIAGRLGDDHTVRVLRRTAAKMSEEAVALAATIDLSATGRRLLERALGAEPDGS